METPPVNTNGDAMDESPRQNDDEIARGLRAGEPHAWDRLYACHAERIWRTTSRYLGGCEADTADVVQETFLEAARTARNYDPAKGPLFAWLWGIARTLTRNRRRRAAQHEHHRGRIAHTAPDLSHGDAERCVLTAECGELVRGVLLELPAEYERLLIAKYWDEESLETIATREGSSAVAVKSKLARARSAFREACPKALLPDEVTT